MITSTASGRLASRPGWQCPIQLILHLKKNVRVYIYCIVTRQNTTLGCAVRIDTYRLPSSRGRTIAWQ